MIPDCARHLIAKKARFQCWALIIATGFGLPLAHGAVPAPQRIAPGVITPIAFVRFKAVGDVSRKRAGQLMNQKLKIGSDEKGAYEFLAVQDGDHYKPYGRTETVSQYMKAIRNGAEPIGCFGNSMDSFFTHATATLMYLKQAKPSKKNLMDHSSLLDLSVSFLNWRGSDEKQLLAKQAKAGFTLRKFKRSGKIVNVKIGRNWLDFDYGGCYYSIRWMAHGDINGDGVEDRLIGVGVAYIGGTGRYYSSYLVTKKQAKQASLKVDDFNIYD